jgi:CPA1 family monovalent cation:H+ antiporter
MGRGRQGLWRTSGSTSTISRSSGVASGNIGHRVSDARTRLHLQTVYAVVVFGLESVVFAPIGLELPTLMRDPQGDATPTPWSVPPGPATTRHTAAIVPPSSPSP